jgi:hypothetical protein
MSIDNERSSPRAGTRALSRLAPVLCGGLAIVGVIVGSSSAYPEVGSLIFLACAGMSAVIDRHPRSLAETVVGAWLVYVALFAWTAITQGLNPNFSWMFIPTLIFMAALIAAIWLPAAIVMAVIARLRRRHNRSASFA